MRPVTLVVVIVILSSCSFSGEEPLYVEQGVLDLSAPIEENAREEAREEARDEAWAPAPITLSRPRPVYGTWGVYVGERREAEGAARDENLRFLEVPPRGSRFYTPGGERLVAGVITYRMRIRGLLPGHPTALRIPLVYGTLRAWVNGIPVVVVGRPGDLSCADNPPSRGSVQTLTTVPRTRVEAGVIVPIIPDETGVADLSICVESAHYPYSGMTVAPPVLGSFTDVLRVRTLSVFRDGLLIGLVLLVAAYHLLLVFSPNRDLPHGVLALFAITVALRLSAIEGEMVLSAIPFLSTTIFMRLQGFAVYTLLPLYTLFLGRFVPLESSRRVFRLVQRLSWLWLVVSLFLPLRWWMDLLFAYYLVLVPGSYATGVTIVRAVRARRSGMTIILAGFMVLLLAAATEILQRLFTVAPAFPLAGCAMAFFLLLNAFAVSRRMVDFRISLSNVWEQAQRDGLTGLFNRRTFDARLQEEWIRHVRSGQSLAVVMVDVDHFKRYNDTRGHQAGDEVLRAVARVMSDMAQRAADIVARYGGEEFVLVLPITKASGAYQLANRILQGVRDTAIPHPASPEGIITVSLGVSAVVPGHEMSHSDSTAPQDLVAAADRALYDAKQCGRNTVRTAAVELPPA